MRLHRLLIALVVLTLLAVVSTPTPVSAQTVEGISTDATYRYVVSEDRSTIETTIDLAVTNIKPNRSTSRGVTQYYFRGYYLSIPEEADNVVVTQDGRNVDVERIDEDGFDTLDISFRRNIFYQNTANLEISFDLGSGEPRSAGNARINAAYVGFEIWVDPTIDTAEVEIVVPPGYDEGWVFGSTGSPNDDGSKTLVVSGLTSDRFYSDYVTMRNDDALDRRSLDIGGASFDLQFWPGDDAWADYIEERLREDLPDLRDAIGLPWPLEDPLVIQESHAPLVNGYGGWFDPSTNVIEIGDQFDDQLVLHELSHVWLNRDLMFSRWITEGLADQLAATVDADGEPVRPDPTSLADANAQPLLNWDTTEFDPERERWGYAASWTVTNEIVELIGDDGLREVIAAASGRHLSYVGEDGAEVFTTLPNWMNYLDWVAERAEDDDEVDDVFRDWVVPPRFLDDMDDRAEARTQYDDLESVGADWAVPFGIRQAMTEWEFDAANSLMADAFEVLAERDRMAVALADLDIAPPPDAEEIYQTSDQSLADAQAATTELADAAESVSALHAEVRADRSFIATIGLIGDDPDGDLIDAIEAFESADFDELEAADARVRRSLESAVTNGLLRVGVGGGALVVIVLAGLIMRRRRPSAASVTRSPTVDSIEDSIGDHEPSVDRTDSPVAGS